MVSLGPVIWRGCNTIVLYQLYLYAICFSFVAVHSTDKESAMASNTQHTFVTSITDEKLPGYKHHHDNIWPEVAAGLRAAGIASLKIYCMPSGTKGVNTLGEA